jgi:hypothetical protein
MKNVETYFRNALRESIFVLAQTDVKAVIEYYGNEEECTFDNYFDAQIRNRCLYDTTDCFDPENFIGFIDDEIEYEFEEARSEVFVNWFCELIEGIDVDTLEDVSDRVELTPEVDTDEDGNEYVSFINIQLDGKDSDMVDYEFQTNGDSYFQAIFSLMGEHSTQDVRKAAVLAGAKYCYVHTTEDDYSLHFWIDRSYDVTFEDAENSSSKGFSMSVEECKSWIMNNRDDSLFKEYQGGMVFIVSRDGEIQYSEEI